MTQEEKELLSKDLCARLPYGVKADCVGERIEIKYIDPSKIYSIYISDLGRTKWESIEVIKPYLRSISSMTEEEKMELCIRAYAPDEMKTLDEKLHVIQTNANNAADFYNEHHIDYRGLIPMGLALEATKNMYKD